MPEQWKEKEMHREYHDIANLFPLMEGAEFEDLKEDIAENGLLEPIWLHPDGSILDGRNRHRACIETEVKPRFEIYRGDSFVQFVVSKNLHRRHLTSSQRAAISLEALDKFEKEARERQNLGQKVDEGEKGRASEHIARAFKTNRQYVSDAKKLRDEAPDLLDKVRSGENSISQAKRELTKRKRKDPPPLPEGKYRIFYADPPWKYGNKGLDDYGHVERHYPTMSLEELCDLAPQIKRMSPKNAVMFLWATSPMLEDAFEIIDAWGWTYKTSFVWDKVKHNFGYYNSVRHEFLLVCTRGSCPPDVQKLFDSVQSIERSDTHSEKPERFREIIDTIYTKGKRIELFARRPADGWDTWGNEPELS